MRLPCSSKWIFGLHGHAGTQGAYATLIGAKTDSQRKALVAFSGGSALVWSALAVGKRSMNP
jgi:hypothetical protein